MRPAVTRTRAGWSAASINRARDGASNVRNENNEMKGNNHRDVTRRPIMLCADEVAEVLQVNLATIYRMAHRRELPAFKVGADWRFDCNALEAWLTEGMKSGR